jgi:GNAT superfamily N-acetyltransferase
VLERFREGLDLQDFDCGNPELNDFLTTDEVVQYQNEWCGFTYLARRASDWTLVGYYTVASDAIEIPDDWIRKRMSNTLAIRRWPALLRGRIATDKKFQGSGVGSLMLKHIVHEALRSPQPPRFVRLTAYQESLNWYLRRGFDFISDKESKKAETPGSKPRLYLDLLQLGPGDASCLIPYAQTPST